jgi:peptide/nickel transport system permease protein
LVAWAYDEGEFLSSKILKIQPTYKVTHYEIRNQPPSRQHWLGTNYAGKDNLLLVTQGTRIAFEIGLLTSVIVIPLGFVLGAFAGYFGRKTDTAITYLFSVVGSIPDILLITAIAYVVHGVVERSTTMQTFTRYVDSGLFSVCVAMGFTGWVGLCRLIRAEYLKHRERQYVLAARALGVSHLGIMFRHIAPNVLHLVIINFSLRFPGLILTEVVLSFLGVGIVTEPSWGAIITDARQRLWLGNWWELTGATVAMFFIVLAFNLFGDALRDALDPKLRTADPKTA